MFDFNDAAPQQTEHPRYDFEAIRVGLMANAESWVPRYFAGGKREGNEWRVAGIAGGSPRKNGSCKIDLTGRYAGWPYDFATGQHGSPIDALSAATGIQPGPDLWALCQSEAGLDRHDSRRPSYPAPRAARDHSTEVAFILQHSVAASGTPVEAYLASRKLALPPTGDLLFNPSLTHFDLKRGLPAMVAIVRHADGKPTGGIHRTYLADDGGGKAAVEKPKMMMGPAEGGTVQLMPMVDGVLGVGEGIETSLAAAQIHGVPVWAALSTSGMRTFVPPPGCARLIVFADAGDAGTVAAGECVRNAQARGVVAEIRRPIGDDDFADDLMHGRQTPTLEAIPAPKPTFTFDELSRGANAMTRTIAPPEINAFLEDLATSKLDHTAQRRVLEILRTRTSIPIKILERTVRQIMQQGFAEDPYIQDICRRYVFVKAAKALWDRQTRAMCSLEAVKYAHWHEMPADENGKNISPLERMLMDRDGVDKVDGVTFWPGQMEILNEDGALKLNIWTRPTIEPQAGNPAPFLNHISYIVDGDPDALDFLLDYLAHLVQFPAIKLKKTVLIIGDEGAGKSIISDMMRTLVGWANTTAIEAANLQSPFNEWVDGVQLIVVNELMTMQRVETMNRLKSYITDATVRINRKNVQTYEYRNRANFLMFSNHDDAASLNHGDRRYFVWISKAVPKPKEEYTELFRWFENGGAEIVLHYLLGHSLAHFDPNSPAPMTDAKRQMIADSRLGSDAYLADALEACVAPFQHDLVTVNGIVDFLADKKAQRISHKAVSKFLRDNGAVLLGQKRLQGHGKLRMWAVRNVGLWQSTSEHEISTYFRTPYEAADQYSSPESE